MKDATILVQPMYSKQELNFDSCLILNIELLRAIHAVRPGWHFLVVFPDKESGFKYEDEGFFREAAGWVTRLPQRIPTSRMQHASTFDAKWYGQVLKWYGVDAALVNLVEVAGHLKFAEGGAFDPVLVPATVAAHTYVMHRSLPYPVETGYPHMVWAQMAGAMVADWNVFISDHCRWMLMDNATRHLAPERVDVLKARSSVIPLGLLDDSNLCDKPKNEVPVIIYNHRLQQYKKYHDTFRLFDELWAEGVRFRVKITYSGAKHTRRVLHKPYVEVCVSNRREDYLKVLATGDLNVTNSIHETFCISAVESMAFGQPLVAPRGVTFPEITGRLTGETEYPYLFETEEEQKVMVRRLLTDTEERLKWGEILQDYVHREYRKELWGERYASLVETIAGPKAKTPGTPDEVVAEVGKVLRQNNGAWIRDLFQGVNSIQMPDGRQPLSGQSCTMAKLSRLVRFKLGGSVRVEQGKQRVYVE